MDTLKCEPIEQDLPGWPHAQLVRLSDEEHGVRGTIHPAAGAEISSLEVRIGDRWQEILYGALGLFEHGAGWLGRTRTHLVAVRRPLLH